MVAAALCARFALGAVFVVAGVHKLRDRESFAAAVRGAGMLPGRYAAAVAVAVPLVEICCGAALAAGLLTSLAALAIAVLTTGFTAVIVTLLARGRAVPCHCFGPASPRAVSWRSVLRNAVIVAAALLVCLAGTPVLAVDEMWRPPAEGTALTHSDAVALLVATTSAMLAALVASRLRRLGIRNLGTRTAASSR